MCKALLIEHVLCMRSIAASIRYFALRYHLGVCHYLLLYGLVSAFLLGIDLPRVGYYFQSLFTAGALQCNLNIPRWLTINGLAFSTALNVSSILVCDSIRRSGVYQPP
jgi:hypothetical protein